MQQMSLKMIVAMVLFLCCGGVFAGIRITDRGIEAPVSVGNGGNSVSDASYRAPIVVRVPSGSETGRLKKFRSTSSRKVGSSAKSRGTLTFGEVSVRVSSGSAEVLRLR